MKWRKERRQEGVRVMETPSMMEMELLMLVLKAEGRLFGG
jgi:hypothetical protein